MYQYYQNTPHQSLLQINLQSSLIDKITKIQAAFPSNASFPVEPGMTPCSYLDVFIPVSQDNVKKISPFFNHKVLLTGSMAYFLGEKAFGHFDCTNNRDCKFVLYPLENFLKGLEQLLLLL